ncbi:6-bladed beta-propeller [Draconibacterium orientale]|uniref:6-bladed beta-propeller n=1 Tax=Draconibacterium orientale TaxID=1168034 RepID=UPI0029C02734|nr:6-bladed beta-propeller [Draconibacterium orientale]
MKITNALFNFQFLIVCSLLVCFACQTKVTNDKTEETTREQAIETDAFYTIPFADIIKNKREVNLSEFASDVEIIQFENTPKALLGRVQDIQLTNDYIFVEHTGNKLITQFSRDGKYIRHIGTLGRGPKEYALCRKFSLDEKNERIYIQTNWTRKILVYNFDGEYIKTVKYPAVERLYNVWSRDSLFISFSDQHTGSDPFLFVEHNEQGDTLQAISQHNFWNSDKTSHSMVSFWGQNSFYRLNNKLHMKSWYNDTVYTYDATNKLVPQYFIDLKNHKIPDDLVYERKSTRPMPEDARWIGVHETENFIFIPYGYHYNIQTREVLKEEEGCVLYNKKTKQGLAVKETKLGGFINDLNGGPDFKPTYTNDTLAVMAVSALDMKLFLDSDEFKNREVKFPEQKELLKQLNQTLKEDDNSFLVLVKLKN